MRIRVPIGLCLFLVLAGPAAAQTNLGVVGGALFPVGDFAETTDISPYIGARYELQDVNALGKVATVSYLVYGGYAFLLNDADYDALLERTRSALPEVELVICEPFVLRCGAIDDTWFPEFDEYRAAARRVADAHATTWVAFQDAFDEAIRYAPPQHWAKDGVHPSSAGAALMAQTWLRAVE